MKQTILFNLDDTLVECNKYFNQTIDRFADKLLEWFPKSLTKQQVKDKQLEIDLKSVDQNGLTSTHFPQSFVDTYLHYCEEYEQTANHAQIEELRLLGTSVYAELYEPLPDMYATLEDLMGQGHELYIHTGGEQEIQCRKISQLEFAAYFQNRVFISQHKDTDALRRIVQGMGFNPATTWMVGNSLRTDVLPGLELGIHVIYIPAQREWQYNMVEIDIEPKGAFLTLQTLKEVPEAIAQYILKHEREIKLRAESYEKTAEHRHVTPPLGGFTSAGCFYPIPSGTEQEQTPQA